jgi:hypothetical protein
LAEDPGRDRDAPAAELPPVVGAIVDDPQGRAIARFPAVYLAWRKRNIYLGIGVHLFLNLVGTIFPIMGIYGGG